MNARIYADHNATSPLLPELLGPFGALTEQPFANPSSVHARGAVARDALSKARAELGAWLKVDPDAVIFTASATEANALALRGHFLASGKRTLLISSLEHPSVSENAAAIGETRPAPALSMGVVDVEALAALLDDDVGVVSVMWANNETGAVQPLDEVAALCRSRGVRLHVDAVQAAGKLEIALKDADTFAVSAHKLGALPGAAALIVTGREPAPWQSGGGQQHGIRGGTEPLHAAVMFGLAAELWRANGTQWRANMLQARAAFESVMSNLADTQIAALSEPRLPNTSCVLVAGVRGQALLSALDLAGIAVSHGAACATGALEPSPVLLAMGYSAALARSAVRVSFGPHASASEGRAVGEALVAAAKRLRRLEAWC